MRICIALAKTSPEVEALEKQFHSLHEELKRAHEDLRKAEEREAGQQKAMKARPAVERASMKALDLNKKKAIKLKIIQLETKIGAMAEQIAKARHER